MSTILVGSAPDSWGVWFPEDPIQTPYSRFLDEVAASGYEWIELGPFGYLPTDPEQLSDELAPRDLKLSAGTVFEHLHQAESRGIRRNCVDADRGRREADGRCRR